MDEIVTPVPLEEVKGYYFKKPEGGGEAVKTDVGWENLNPLEQELTKLIIDGRYGDAYKLSGEGKADTYNREVLKGFLDAVIDQHDKNLGRSYSNVNVRGVINI